jgi:hypothetical protein
VKMELRRNSWMGNSGGCEYIMRRHRDVVFTAPQVSPLPKRYQTQTDVDALLVLSRIDILQENL